MDIDVELDELHEYLAIPYVAVIYSVEKEDGEWVRRAEYPELPDCAVEAETATEAIELLEEARVRVLVEFQRRGETPPRPRPPLRSGVSGLSPLPLEDLLRKVLLGEERG
jgi:predicted RNase H-like HicB family nuclease